MELLFERCRYEIRRLGWLAFVVPPIIVLVFGGIAWLMRVENESATRAFRMLFGGLEIGVPLIAGLIAINITTNDPARDLQFTLPYRYIQTIGWRLSMLVGWVALLAVASLGLLQLFDFWHLEESFLTAQLGWISPVLWFVALGALAPLVLQSRSGASALLSGIWLFENAANGLFEKTGWLQPIFLFATSHDPGQSYWLSNRLVLLGMALVFFALLPSFLERSANSFTTGGE